MLTDIVLQVTDQQNKHYAFTTDICTHAETNEESFMFFM